VLVLVCSTQFHVETSQSRVVADDESFFFLDFGYENKKGLGRNGPDLDAKTWAEEEAKAEKILQRMITNFKSDYGNLLLSGLATTELNIPRQIKSGSRNFYDSLNEREKKA
jgi:hypothetical protein